MTASDLRRIELEIEFVPIPATSGEFVLNNDELSNPTENNFVIAHDSSEVNVGRASVDSNVELSNATEVNVDIVNDSSEVSVDRASDNDKVNSNVKSGTI